MALEKFEKWWKKTSTEGDWDYENYAKEGWCAALEWVNEALKLEICPGDIGYFVDKELANGN